MFVDEAVITCSAGMGGKGCHSFDRSRPGHFRANGGDGGPGGSVVLEAQPNIHTLLDFQLKHDFSAEPGGHGSSNHKRGHAGADCVLGVPTGTEVLDDETGELLKDLVEAGSRVTVCRGGAGGHGNDKKRQASDGEPGERKPIRLKLKLIADVGLVGFPNAGKSTFLSRVSHARSKAAAYPFTTKKPVLGVVKFEDGEALVLADIPGIIEGAHTGKGLGLEFLKHVERTRILLHLVDLAGVDGRDPVDDYRALNRELASYSKALAEKKQFVVANKMDLPEAGANLARFKKKTKEKVCPISAITGEGIDQLLNKLRTVISSRVE